MIVSTSTGGDFIGPGTSIYDPAFIADINGESSAYDGRSVDYSKVYGSVEEYVNDDLICSIPPTYA